MKTRSEQLLQLQKDFLELKGEEIDLDRALDLVERILLFTDALLKDIDALEIKTRSVEERQHHQEKSNTRILELLQLLIQLSYTAPERALLLLQSMSVIQQNDNHLN